MPKIAAKSRAGVAPPKKPNLESATRVGTAVTRSPKRFHLDKRVPSILAVDAAEDDDDLLTTNQLAAWLQVSVQWLSIARHRGHGPPFARYGTLNIRYRRGDVRRWLKARTFQWTKEYDARRPQP